MVKRTTEQWRELFIQHDESGLSAAQYCRDNNLCAKHFCKRRIELCWSSASEKQAQLVKLKTFVPSSSSMHITLKINELKVEFDGAMSPQWVAQLIKALA